MLSDLLGIFGSIEFYVAIIRMTTPLLLAAIGGLLAEKAGLVTFSMEGMMLMGTVGGVIGSGVSGNVWVGVLLAMVFGMLTGLVYAIMAVSVGSHQIVTCVALNMGAAGLSAVLFALVFAGGAGGVIEEVIQVEGLSLWKIPLLGDIPVIGPIFFNHYPLVYLAFIMVPVVWFLLYRTTWGLKVRAVGEHPHAADAVGINVIRVRYTTLLIAGAMAGLAGAFLSIAALSNWEENMTSGRGFIAYTAIVFGKWEPVGVFLGTLLFGMADALQLRMQTLNINIPYQLMVAFPYAVTLVALMLFVGKASCPAASGFPFKREDK